MNEGAVLDPQAVIAELRRRLAEAEDTLRAIREGEVDALVVKGPQADEIFTIEGDAHSYRAFMEAMEPGAAALDRDGRVLYANATLCALLGQSLEELQGKPLAAAMPAEAGAGVTRLIRDGDPGRRSTELRFDRIDEEPLHFLVSSMPLRIGTVGGHALTFADVTERVRAEVAEQSERAAKAIIASANEAVVVCDRDGVITHANAAAGILVEGDPVGKKFEEVIPLVFPGAAGLMQADDVVAMAVNGHPVQGIEAVAPKAPKVKDYLVSAAPLQVSGDQPSGCVITLVDLSARKAAEKQQLLLMGELDHRVKNTLALVLSISSRTLSSEDTLEGFQAAFTGRIQALAATHTLLAEKSWTNLTIADVVVAELAPYVDSAGRISTEGLDVAVSPRAAIAVGLIFHELATNAVKYGALSRESGLVTVRAQKQDAAQALNLAWIESGGPTVVQPTRRGFGRTVITRSLQYSPHGGAQIDFRPEGVVCTIAIPAEDLS
jgi:PAS domain S-box-containing protein